MFDHDIKKELGNTHFADGYEDECADMNFARNPRAAIAETKERFGIDLRHLPEDAPLFVRLYARLLVPNDGVNAIYLNQVRFDMMRLGAALCLNEHKEDGAQYARFVSTLSGGLPIKSPKKMALRMQRHFAISPLGLSGQDNSTATRVQHRNLRPIQA